MQSHANSDKVKEMCLIKRVLQRCHDATEIEHNDPYQASKVRMLQKGGKKRTLFPLNALAV